MFNKGSTTSSSNIFGGGNKTSNNPFSTNQTSNNPFGNSSNNTNSANPFGGNSSTDNNANPFNMVGMGANESSMYLSSNNPNRHAKLNTFADNIKAGFYFIENKLENNERYRDAVDKNLLEYASMRNSLKEETNEALKAVKGA